VGVVARRTRSELSTGLPLPLPMPQAHRKKAQVMAIPMRIASTLLISGKVVILHRKYTELEMIEAEVMRRPIWKDMVSTHEKQSCAASLIPSNRHHPRR